MKCNSIKNLFNITDTVQEKGYDAGKKVSGILEKMELNDNLLLHIDPAPCSFYHRK